MALSAKDIASRLRQVRETLAYSLGEVCDACALDVTRLQAIESGSLKPSGDEVLILASFYDCDFRSLLDDALPPPIQQTDVLFRRYGESFSPKDRRAVQEFIFLCQMEDSLERLLGQKARAFSFEQTGSFYKAHGQQAAETLRDHLRYREIEAPRDIYSDFRAIGIHIFRKKLANSEVSGLYIEDPIAGHCVLVNYNEDVYRQRFSTAHEVAHAIFDSSQGVMLTYVAQSSRYNNEELREVRANSFASHYLMPLSMLKRLPKLDESSALYWSQQFRVSTAALAKALKDAGLIDEHMARKIRSIRVPKDEKIDPEASETLTTLQKERRLELLERGLSAHYVDLGFKAFDQGLISAGRLAEILRVDYAELSDIGLLFGRAIKHVI